jgi:hypothetical protein
MATAAAAAVAKARRTIISYFRDAGAVSSDTAVNYPPQRRIGERVFDRLRRQDIVRAGKNGGFYVDLAAWDKYALRQRRVVFGVMAILLVLVAVVVLMTVKFR